ncbi:MAG: cupin domain-containing protein [Gammaproteobacteria bacterium]|nr:cupin domain-containing protein [Gammaproteobacteria bacterium]MDH3858788.1 cupin domain-containing protein [Gammaproteobacteria bacterium]
MKQKLHKELQALLDFYLQQRNNLPEAFTHRSGVINNPSFFKVEDLQRHLNNPLLKPEWVHVKLDGIRVELEKSCFYKTVQSRKLYFMDKELLNNEINKGAAVVLEGIDVLDSNINDFAARLDNSLPCVLTTAEVFFSQQDNEAYEGHCDADDVLVVQLAGKKNWQLFQPQQRRYAEIQDLNDQQLGPVMQEIPMRPGDALYLRAGVPHRCITSAPFSLHMSFDLVDNTPTTADIAGEATNQYRHACELPYEPASRVVDRYVSILKSEEFQAALEEATAYKREDIGKFRQMLGRSSAIRSLSKFN